MALSPSDYQRSAGNRRSYAPRAYSGRPELSGPIQAYEAYDLSDPALLELMRGMDGRVGVTGRAVNERVALRNSTFNRALTLQCGSMGMLPIHLRRRVGRNTEKASDHPLYNVLLRKPNSYQSASKFKSYMQLVALLDGSAYALKVKSRGAVRQLIPLPRRAVKPELSATFDLTFKYTRPNGGTVTLQPDDVFHFSTPLSLDGLNGVSLLDVAADTLGLAMVSQQAAGRLLTKGSMARGALETEQTLGDEAIANLKQSLRDDYSGAGADHDLLILEEGLKAKMFGTSARDSQLVEIMKRQGEDIARFTGVPRPLLMFDETSWGSGIEQLSLFFITYCLMGCNVNAHNRQKVADFRRFLGGFGPLFLGPFDLRNDARQTAEIRHFPNWTGASVTHGVTHDRRINRTDFRPAVRHGGRRQPPIADEAAGAAPSRERAASDLQDGAHGMCPAIGAREAFRCAGGRSRRDRA